MVALILVMLIGLAAANGANDVSKGVATLAGAGVTAYRTAILWGTAATAVGALLSIQLGRGMGKLFSTGIFAGTPTNGFALAVLIGAASWVTLASITKLPVSTTHALVGSLIGAGLVLQSGEVRWGGLVPKVVEPLLLSIAVAYVISLVLTMLVKLLRSVTAPKAAATEKVPVPAGGPATTESETEAVAAPEAAPEAPPSRFGPINVLHWLSSGLASAARGLNDTPKIAAVGGFALIPAGYSANAVSLVVAVAMTLGSLLGIRVARRLGEKVVKLSHEEGFTANLTTAGLVGLGGVYGWPMSTTQVSTGAIVGTAGLNLSRLSGKTLRDFAIAWLVTPIWGALAGALVMALAK
ncbi:inorganic phosphate transporter [Dactylosporangium sp. CA-092794]|uniref:inorganic phosphate transporter n=1 Tax=Dactylosporangium sp. CA-092794 TaxID=3239929 RepID=UPI003D8A7F88